MKRYVLIAMLCISNLVFAAQMIRYQTHNAYHRTEACMLQRLSELLHAYPIGSKYTEVVEQLDVTHRVSREEDGSQITQVNIDDGDCPESDRYVCGFGFVFRDGVLEAIVDNNPCH